jgi:hypothetical protein
MCGAFGCIRRRAVYLLAQPTTAQLAATWIHNATAAPILGPAAVPVELLVPAGVRKPSQMADIPSIKAPSLLPRGEIGGEQIRIEALNKPFEEIFAAALVGGSICFDEEIEIRSAKAPFGDLVTAQCVRKTEVLI